MARLSNADNLPTRSLECFSEANSVARVLACQGLRWSSVLNLALALQNRAAEDSEAAHELQQGQERNTSDSSLKIVLVVQLSSGECQVADVASLEIVLAHALLDRLVLARVTAGGSGVRLDPSKLFYEHQRCGTPVRPSGLQLEEGWRTLGPHTGSSRRVRMLMDPAIIAHSRDRDCACWPKVWFFAQKLLVAGDDPAREDFDGGLGPVPVRWNADAGRWVAGNRHRVVASLLLGRPLVVCAKVKQVTRWASDKNGVLQPAELRRLV
eukprot:gene19776-23652_t